MTVPEIDIFRSAQLLVKKHGEDAILVAASNADAMLGIGDTEGLRTWKRILLAIEELLSTERTIDQNLH